MVISNESSQHRHHVAMQKQGGGNGETRKLGPALVTPSHGTGHGTDFSVVVVSDVFTGKARTSDSIGHSTLTLSASYRRTPCNGIE